MRWAGNVACIGERKCAVTFWWGNHGERDYLEDQCTDERIILRWIFRKWDGRTWTGLIWRRIGTGAGHLSTRSRTFGFRKM